MKFQSFSNQLRPTSKISDYLPSNVIDEIEFNQSKLSQSFNNFAAFNNNHFQQGHVSRKNTTSTLSQVSNQNLLFIQPQFFFNQMNPRSFSANQLPNQNLYFNTNNQYDYKFNSFNALHNTNSIPFNPNAFIPQIQNQLYINQPPTQNNNSITETQIDNLSNQNSIINLFENSSPSIILQYIKTSKGSRHLQKMINNSPPSQFETDILVNVICPTIADVMCDYYGNYFLQKFFPYCSLNHRLLFYSFIKPNFTQIANNICGNHSLQCLITLQNSNEEMNIIKECIENNLQSLAFGANSSHVIQKVIKSIKENNRDYINAFIISNLTELCVDPNGICIVKEFISRLENEFYIIAVASILELEVNRLTYDQYGNFGIQELIKTFGKQYCQKIINKIIEHVFMFSISKFSSNVVDCVIRYLYQNDKQNFSKIVIKLIFDENCLNEMFKNKYSTYVLENCLSLLFSDDNSNQDLCNLRKSVYKMLMNKTGINEKKKIYQLLKTYASRGL